MWNQVKLKLTNRERNLLGILGICLIAAILYYAAIKPQLDMVGKLEKQAKEYSISINRMKEKADPNNPMYKEYNALYNKTQELLKPFYPSIIQEKLIALLEAKIKESNITVKAMTFSEPSPTEAQSPKSEPKTTQNNDLEVLTEQLENDKKTDAENKEAANKTEANLPSIEKMSVTINLEGTYIEIYNFIKSIEKENRSIAISNLNLDGGNGSLLKGVLVLDFYSIPKPFDQDNDYLNWDIKGNYGKANPFGDLPIAPQTENITSDASIANP